MKKHPLSQLDADIEQHIAAETEENITRGMTPRDARHAALRKFGNVTRMREEVRAVWIPVWLDQLRQENEGKLEQMRATVEEKLQGTLETRLGESFKLVSERLEMVHKGLGEMQAEQLWKTTLDPNARTLLQVKVTHADEAEEVFSTLMGDLGAESIDFLDIVFRLEKAFDIKIPRVPADQLAGAKALQPPFQPTPEILKEGKEYNQGVAYLDDGTMVVVDNARKMIGKTIDTSVTSVLQTTAGKMIFGRYEERAHNHKIEAVGP